MTTKETIIENSKKTPKENLIENFEVVTNMTKWQRMRLKAAISASDTFSKFVHMLVFVGIVLMIAARTQSQAWYNWKNDERVLELERRVVELEMANSHDALVELSKLDERVPPHKAMHRYWEIPEHPPVGDASSSAINKVVGDKFANKVKEWSWRHTSVEMFACVFLLAVALSLLLLIVETAFKFMKKLVAPSNFRIQ